MKNLFCLMLLSNLPLLLLAQNKPPKNFLPKKMVQDSIYVSNRWNAETESNAIPIVNESDLKEPPDYTPTLLQASKYPYLSITGFQFSVMRIAARGLVNTQNTLLVNGMPMNDISNGAGLWNNWNGLNSIFRITETGSVFQQSDAGISILGASSNIDIRPFKQKAGIDLRYGFGNRGSTHRILLDIHSGISQKGWSWGMAISARASLEPMIPGVRNQGRSVFLGIDKKIGSADILSLVLFGSYLQSDRQAAVLMESVEILEDQTYNPAWGYQNGQQRNANQNKQFLPVLMLTEEHKFSNQSFLQTSFSYSSGYKNGTGLDWYHAPDPRPDYYRYLPCFQSDPFLKKAETIALQSNVDLRQLNWQRFYQINSNSFETIENANGIIGNTVSGKRANYVLENRHQDLQRIQLAISFHGLLKEGMFFSAGSSLQVQKNHYYKTVADLLGASFYVNWNQFAESEIPYDSQAIQFNIHQPNGIVKKEDKFGYDYSMVHYKTNLWFQTSQQIGKWGWGLSLELSQSGFWRDGLVANGLFPDKSLGLSKKLHFLNKGIRFSLNRAISGRARLFLAMAVQSSPPNAENVFLSTRTRNDQQDIILNQQITSTEIGYLWQTSVFKSRMSLYWIQLKEGLDVLSFYHDAYNSFVNYAISGIGERHLGLEWGIDAKLFGQWHFQAGLHIGNFVYNTRQFASVTVDNTASNLNQVLIYAKNHPIGGAPQQALSLGFNTRTQGNWFWSFNANFFDRQWMVWNPIRRTAEAIFPIDPNSEKGNRLLLQERLPPKV